MYDFSCTNPDDMNHETLAKKARYFKQDEKKVAAMCKIMEDMGNEAAQKAELKSAKETAERLIKKGKMTLEVRSVSPCSLSVTASEHIGTEIYMLFLPLRRNMGD
mgnify:CR=1 FL=1